MGVVCPALERCAWLISMHKLACSWTREHCIAPPLNHGGLALSVQKEAMVGVATAGYFVAHLSLPSACIHLSLTASMQVR